MDASVNGLRLHYDVHGDHGSLVVLTHGLGGDATFFAAHVPTLARHHRVLCWDLRGAGRSAKPAGPYSPALFARDLAALLDHLGERRGHLVGHSGGGVVSQRFALDFPDRTESLVLASTSSEVGEKAARAWQRLADLIERQGFGPERDPDPRGFSPVFAAAHPAIVRELARRTRENDPAAYAATARAFGRYNWTSELRSVRAPTLILQGLDDQMTPPGGSVILARALPHARLLMLPGAGHNFPLETPELFSEITLAFLAGLELVTAPP